MVNSIHVSSPRQDSRFVYLASHELYSIFKSSDELRRKKFQRLDTTNLEIKYKLSVLFKT